MLSAVTVVEKSRRNIKKYDAEEITYKAKIDEENLPKHLLGVPLANIIHLLKSIFQKILDSVTAVLMPRILFEFVFIMIDWENPFQLDMCDWIQLL